MIDVDVILDDDLPVRLDLVAGAPIRVLDQLVDIVGTEMWLDLPEPLHDRARVRVRVDK